VPHEPHFDDNTLGFFRHTLNSSFLTFNGQFYEQTDDSNGFATFHSHYQIFHNHFEETAPEGAANKPLCWFPCVDDTLVI
jgi:hypothetical protein